MEYRKHPYDPRRVQKYDPETIRFETTRRISNPQLSKEEMATAVFEAVADSGFYMDSLQTREDVYRAVLSRIRLSEGVINSG